MFRMGSQNGETLNFAFFWVAEFLLIHFSETTSVKTSFFVNLQRYRTAVVW